MCIDYGTKRTGVAFSDPSRKFALASKVISSKKKIFFIEIKKILKDYNIGSMIVGIPLNYDKSENKRTQSIKDIIKNLDNDLYSENIKIPIIFWDESYSSIKASEKINFMYKNIKKQKKVIDKFAASEILQDFLDFLNK